MIHDALSQHLPLETLGPPAGANLAANLADLAADLAPDFDADGDDSLPRWTIPVPSLERTPSGEWARFFGGGGDDTVPPPSNRSETDTPRQTSARLDTLPCPPPEPDDELENDLR